MITVFQLFLAVFSVVLFLVTLYLAALALLGRWVGKDESEKSSHYFDVIVPAHNEAKSIASTIDCLLSIDYPVAQRRIIVVADNCNDETARIARARGVSVWERDDVGRRGKGPALNWAFRRSLCEGFADAVVVIDADTKVSRNLLKVFSSRLSKGAQVLQANYRVWNEDDSWRTILLTLALALFHEVRSLGRERLGLSSGLRGNGMCFSQGIISRFPHRAESVVEDIEYGLILGAGGVRVRFVSEAVVWGEMPSKNEPSMVQRARWEGGRRKLAKEWAPYLIIKSIRERSLLMFDLALDLLIPPVSTIGVLLCGGLLLSLVVYLAGAWWLPVALISISMLLFTVYLWIGVLVSGLGWKGVQVFLWAPVYLVWRIVKVRARRREAANEWVRTPR